MKAGETFHAQSPSSTRPHLYVAITDPDSEGNIVLVNLTSQSQLKDQSCILNVGDHPFIKHETVINYADAVIAKEEAILAGARGGVIQYDPIPVTQHALERIQQGALTSSQAETQIRTAVQAFLVSQTNA